MIDKISSKQSDPDGQLEVIDKRDCSTQNIYSDIVNVKNNPQIILACNQLCDISQVIDFARHNLILSSGHMSREFTKKFMNTGDLDAIETISSFFLSNSILFYNSSFDYLWIMIKLIFSYHNDLIQDFPKDKIEKKMKNYKLMEDEWFKALFKKYTFLNFEERKKWVKKNPNISDEIKKRILDLFEENGTLKENYQANNLKHGEFPYFRRSNLQNVLGAKWELSKEQFYLKSGSRGISFGLPKNGLNIDDVQKFLIDYNNRTVEVVNLMNSVLKT